MVPKQVDTKWLCVLGIHSNCCYNECHPSTPQTWCHCSHWLSWKTWQAMKATHSSGDTDDFKTSAALPLWSPDPTLQAPRSQNRYSRTLFICWPVFERGLKFYKFSITIMMLYINSIYWLSKFLYWVGRLYQSLQKYLRCNPWWTDRELWPLDSESIQKSKCKSLC